MANKKLDYSVETGDIAAPSAANGELLVAAGRSMGKAAEIEGTSNANNIAFLGNMALAATKGYLESEADKQVKGVLDNLVTSDDKGNIYRGKAAQARWDEHGSKAQAAVLAANDLISQRDQMDDPTFLEGGGTGPINAEISAMRTEAQKWATAASNGNVDRDTAIAQIAAVVKKYSAMAPGWASDFRKIGAEATGISNIDVYGIHKLLTQQGLNERMAAKAAEYELEITKKIAEKKGYSSLSMVTKEDRLLHMAEAELARRVTEGKKLKELHDLGQEKADRINTQLANDLISKAIVGLADEFGAVFAANQGATDSGKALEASRLTGQLAGKLEVLERGLEEQLHALTLGKNPMSREAHKAVSEDLRLKFKNYREGVKSAEGANFFKQIVETSKGDVELLKNKLTLGNPLMFQLKELGVSQQLAQAYITMGSDAFGQRFGKDLKTAYDKAMREPQAMTTAFTNVARGTTTVDEETARDPAMGRVTYNEVVETMRKLIKDGDGKFPDDKAKTSFVNMLGAWVSSNQFDPSRKPELDRFRELVLNPNFGRMMEQLDQMQRQQALAPVFARLRTQVPADIGQVRQLVEQFDALSASKEWGAKFELSYDTVSGLVMPKVSYEAGKLTGGGGPGKGKPLDQLGDTMFSGQFGAYREARTARTLTGEQADLKQKIEGRLNWLNTVPAALEATLPYTSKDTTINSFQTRTEIWRGLKEGGEVNLFEGKLRDAAGVPRNTSQPMDRVLDALGWAESNNNPKAVGDGGKAVGQWQMHPAAAEEVGLSPEDRSNPEKAKKAAEAYFSKQLQTHNGDITKALAAWNMGPTGFKNHMERHGDMWMMELPDATKTLIRRFRERMAKNGGAS